MGQTINLSGRHKTHIKYDPYNPNTKEYDYPLSRGIRKHGEEEYELIVLEKDVPLEKLNERETYYIELYDTYNSGYNQNIGGSHNTNWYLYDDEIIDMIVSMLKDNQYSLPDIVRITGVSMTHVYNINLGIRRFRKDETYPIRDESFLTRGQKLTKQDVEEIRDILKNTTIPISEIKKMYNCSTISLINSGVEHCSDEWEYPIRKPKITKEVVNLIKHEIVNTEKTFKDIACQYGVTSGAIGHINNGRSYRELGVEYPLRKKIK